MYQANSVHSSKHECQHLKIYNDIHFSQKSRNSGHRKFPNYLQFQVTKPTHVVLLSNFSCQTLDKLLFSHKIKCERILAKRDRYYLSYVSFIIIYIGRIYLVSSISRCLLIFLKTMRLHNGKSYRKISNFIIGCIKQQ